MGFRLLTTLVFVVLLAAITGAIVYFSQMTPDDQQEYQQLIESSQPPASQADGKTRARQHRSFVVKDIWLSQHVHRLHFRVKSQSSDLVFIQQDVRIEVVEYLNKVKCFMQEELFYQLPDGREVVEQPSGRLLIRNEDPALLSSWIDSKEGLAPMQEIRYLEAETATYHYSTNLFVAKEVLLFRYRIPGHRLVENISTFSPTMKGTAEQVEFSLEGSNPSFKARRLQATFYSPRGIP